MPSLGMSSLLVGDRSLYIQPLLIFSCNSCNLDLKCFAKTFEIGPLLVLRIAWKIVSPLLCNSMVDSPRWFGLVAVSSFIKLKINGLCREFPVSVR
jgi:hypothetical protein